MNRRSHGSPAPLRLIRALAILTLSACSSVRVSTDYDPDFDFSTLHTYAWKAGTPAPTGDARLDSTLVDERIRRAVDEALAARGYDAVSADRADFLVTYRTGVQQKVAMTAYDTPRGARWNWEREIDVYEYEQGSLILDVLDRDGERLRWRGHAEATLRDSATPEERETRIREAVNGLLEDFPPGH